jgi:superfamily II DNA or RNA helicase
MTIPEQGQLVMVRNKYFIIQDVHNYSDISGHISHRITLESVDEDDMGETMDVIWELEPNTIIREAISLPKPENWDSLCRFQAFIYAMRWSTSSSIERHIFSSPFHAAINIEDYQLEPLYRTLEMPRVNLLLADDVGIGKTIEAGLVLQELLATKRIKRILVLCPASLQIKWKEEMESKFQLPFVIIDRSEIQNLRKEYGINVNPWNTFPRLITSFDFLKREQPLSLFRQSLQKHDLFKDWDLLIVDEAHNIAPSGIKNYIQDSDRTKLLMAIIDNFENRLFLTATPHNGYTESFTALLELIDPLRFSRGPILDKKQLQTIMVRRLKEEIEDALGRKKFAIRKVKSFTVELNDDESKLHELLNRYTVSRISRTSSSKLFPVRFILTLLKKRLLSSPLSFYKSIKTHYDTIVSTHEIGDQSLLKKFQARTIEDWENDDEKTQYENTAIQEGSKFFKINEQELIWVNEMIKISNDLKERIDTKAQTILEWISKNMKDGKKWNNERLVIFTEYKDTIEYLRQIFEKKEFSKHISILTGGMLEKDREAIKQTFQSHPDINPVRILLATDAISEGIDLQNYCKNLIHWEIPWNPNRMEQRNGRIDRHGQKSKEVYIWHFVFNNNEDSKFLQTVVDKVETMRQDLGSVSDIIAVEIEKAIILGLSNKKQLKLDSIAEQINKSKRDIDYRKINNKRISELRNKLESSKQELEINQDNLLLLLDQGLKLINHWGLKPIENGELKGKGYLLTNMPEVWHDLEPTIRDSRGNLKTIIFNPNIEILRSDRVLLHLNHPLMKRVINEFRRHIWTEGFHNDRKKLYKTSYKILSHDILKVPRMIVFVRILAISKNNQKIHESIQILGAEINKDQLIWLNEKNVQISLKSTGTFKDIPKDIGDFLRKNFSSYELQIKDKILELQKSETLRIKYVLKEFINNEIATVKSLIKDRIQEINARISNVTDSQMKITDFTEEEHQQLQDDLIWLRRRKLKLEEQLHIEPQRIKTKFDLSKEVRIFPLGILYLLPEDILKE